MTTVVYQSSNRQPVSNRNCAPLPAPAYNVDYPLLLALVTNHSGWEASRRANGRQFTVAGALSFSRHIHCDKEMEPCSALIRVTPTHVHLVSRGKGGFLDTDWRAEWSLLAGHPEFSKAVKRAGAHLPANDSHEPSLTRLLAAALAAGGDDADDDAGENEFLPCPS